MEQDILCLLVNLLHGVLLCTKALGPTATCHVGGKAGPSFWHIDDVSCWLTVFLAVLEAIQFAKCKGIVAWCMTALRPRVKCLGASLTTLSQSFSNHGLYHTDQSWQAGQRSAAGLVFQHQSSRALGRMHASLCSH